MSSRRKIDLMHHIFGKIGGNCKNCNNLVIYRYHNRVYRKCKVYGESSSETTDWANRYEACGMFNKHYDGRPVIELVKCRANRINEDFPLEGQLSIESEATSER